MKLKLKQILSKILNRLLYTGEVYTASWIATESSANNVRVTDRLTLPAGTYILFLKVPVCSQSNLFFQIWSGADANYTTSGNISGAGQSVFSCVATYIETTIIYGRTNFSAETTYTYLERGYLKAVRIA